MIYLIIVVLVIIIIIVAVKTSKNNDDSTTSTDQINKVVNVTLNGGLIGLFSVSPQTSLKNN